MQHPLWEKEGIIYALRRSIQGTHHVYFQWILQDCHTLCSYQRMAWQEQTTVKRNIPWIPHRNSQRHVLGGEFGIADRITLSQPVNVSRIDRFFIWKEVLLRIRAPPLTTEYFFRYILNSAAPVLDVNFLEAQGRFFVSGLKRPHHKKMIS